MHDRYSSGKPRRHYRSDVIRAWEKSGLKALDMPFQGVLNEPLQTPVATKALFAESAVNDGDLCAMLLGRSNQIWP